MIFAIPDVQNIFKQSGIICICPSERPYFGQEADALPFADSCSGLGSQQGTSNHFAERWSPACQIPSVAARDLQMNSGNHPTSSRITWHHITWHHATSLGIIQHHPISSRISPIASHMFPHSPTVSHRTPHPRIPHDLKAKELLAQAAHNGRSSGDELVIYITAQVKPIQQFSPQCSITTTSRNHNNNSSRNSDNNNNTNKDTHACRAQHKGH